jgi:hypothetical protein
LGKPSQQPLCIAGVISYVFLNWNKLLTYSLLHCRNEVKEQNGLLDNMGDAFQNTRDMLGNSLTRIGTMLQSGGAKHMCYMVAFGVGVLIFVWWLMHWKS